MNELCHFIRDTSGVPGLPEIGQAVDCHLPEAGKVPMCHGCSGEIRELHLLHVSPDMEWHSSCLRCSGCHLNLAEERTCFLRNGKTYCRADYLRLFSVKCAYCQDVLQPSDLVLRAHEGVYHHSCFRCSDCHQQLLPGDQFTKYSEGLHCLKHLPPVERPVTGEVLSRPIRIVYKENQKHAGWCPSPCSPARGTQKASMQKPSRVRTVLTEQQLQALRTCYSSTPRPDTLLKEQLMEVTGLSSRVIRVWFQNKRCKDKKRILLAQSGLQRPGEVLSLQGAMATQMVAKSPEPQVDGDLWCPVEVTSCKVAQPYKMDDTLPSRVAVFSQLAWSGTAGCRAGELVELHSQVDTSNASEEMLEQKVLLMKADICEDRPHSSSIQKHPEYVLWCSRGIETHA